jgi:hypothetical protein
MQLDRINTGKAPAETEFEKNLEKSFQRLLDQLTQILNKGLVFSDNFSIDILIFTSQQADSEFPVTHNLRRVPTGYIVIGMDKAGLLYNGATAWTSTNIYLKASLGATTFKALIF